MADPVSIIGTAGAVANIIDILGKTIGTIREVHQQWKNADFTFINLIAQLVALKAALTKIKEWAEMDLVDQHHQLVMDLDVSLACIRMLVSRIDAELVELQSGPDGSLEATSKIKLILNGSKMDDLQKMLERQISALNLLLSACNCKTLTDQKFLLERSSTRKVIRRIEKDTASLVVHRDTSSFFSQYTDKLSRLSAVFTFDKELFVSNVYERALRGSLKEALRRQQLDASSVDVQNTKQSLAIDRSLQEDARTMRRECKVLLLGAEDSGKSDTVKCMKMTHGECFTTEDPCMYRSMIYKTVVDCAKALVDALEHLGIEPEEKTSKAHCDYVRDFVVNADSEFRLGENFGHAIAAIWSDPCMVRLLERRNEFYLMDSAPYFFDEIDKISASNYIPREADVLKAEKNTIGVHETRCKIGQLSINMIDVGTQRSERKKWIHQFENVTSIVFFMNLASYDEMLLEDSSQNRALEAIALFDAVVNSRWFKRTSVILFLNNVKEFRSKLATSPLANYFPDYTGGNDVNRAAKYILWRFNQVNRAHLNLYPHLAESDDPSSLRLIFAAIKETILSNALHGE